MGTDMVPYIAAYLIVEYNSLILCFFGSNASKKEVLIIYFMKGDCYAYHNARC